MRFKLAAFGVLASVVAASAADMPGRYAPPPPYAPPAPIYAPALGWNGFYVGGFGGYGWSDSQGLKLKGAFGGVTAGYNWQVTPSWLFGLEGEVAAADIGQKLGTIGAITVNDKIQAFGSIAARLGYVWGPGMVYLKGGYGAASNKLSATGLGVAVSDSQIHSGFVIGGGLEYMFVPSWSAKLEYLYSAYGSKNYFPGAVPGGLPSGKFDVQTIKLGVNYNFNWGPGGGSGPGPLVTRY